MTEVGTSPGLATIALHAGEAEGADEFGHAGKPVPRLGSVPDSDWLAKAGRSERQLPARLEERIAALEGGTAAIAFASAGAGLATTFQALLKPGDEIIAARSLKQGPLGRLEAPFRSLGWAIVWAETNDSRSFERAVSPRTQAVVAESLSESEGAVADLSALADVARRAQVPLIVDNSAATPALCRPIGHGADVVVHASGDRLAGAPSDCGIIVDAGTFDWTLSGRYPLFSENAPDFGGTVLGESAANFALVAACRLSAWQGLAAEVAPADAGAILAGLETLPLRMRRHSENAEAVAAFLFAHRGVTAVSHAGLPGDRHYMLAQRFCAGGAGPVVTFAPAGGANASTAVLQRLRLFSGQGEGSRSRASLALPAGGAGFAESRRIRLFVGIEDSADLIADLERALRL